MTRYGLRVLSGLVPSARMGRSTVAVTGGAGFIGSAVCRRLTEMDIGVVGLDVARDPGERLEGVPVDYRMCDVRDAAATRHALSDADTVVHAAALVSTWGRKRDFRAVNVAGTRNVLDACAAGRRDPRIIHVSTVSVWGYDSAEPIVDEDAPPRACPAPYAQTKSEAELMARSAGAIVIRPGDVYGPGAMAWSLRAVTKLQAGTFFLPDRGEGLMAPTYIDDLVDCVARAVVQPGTVHPRSLTVWDGNAVKAREFFGYLARMAGGVEVPLLSRRRAWSRAVRLEVAGRLTGRRPPMTRHALLFMSRRAVFPNTNAKAALGWRPEVPLPEGMRRTQQWLQRCGVL